MTRWNHLQLNLSAATVTYLGTYLLTYLLTRASLRA